MSSFLPEIPKEELDQKIETKDWPGLYDLLVTPLHEELYRRQDFNMLDELSPGQQLILSYDYVRTQVLQGGFIQFIQNGYVALLVDMPEWLMAAGDDDMAQLLDDVLKVYVLNRELLDQKTTVEEFAKLYEELKEFEFLDNRFAELDPETTRLTMEYAAKNLGDFVKNGTSD